MGKKDKKKGKGAEKTALKTEKKALNKFKKKLAAKGEDDIEKLIAECQKRSKKSLGEETCSQPAPRSGFTFTAHPDKEEILLFGGEYFNGRQTTMYDDIYFYNIKRDQWSILNCPEKPPPRCSHQAVALSQQGGQLWIFGGEFASPSRSNFYHYKDLWVFHLTHKRWEQIKVPGAPCARSGHRMVASQKQLFVFGGFQESIGDYKYFNDVHIFNLETYQWVKIEPVGKGPSPRSGCQMVPITDGRIMVYGGYSREKIKKDVDKGIAHVDMYYLQLDERTQPPKWKWIQVKPSGILPSPRSGFSIAIGVNNHAYAFGGVRDEDIDEESLNSVFYNDLYLLELEHARWVPLSLHGKFSKDVKKKRRKVKDGEEEDIEAEVMEGLQTTKITEPEVTAYDDGIFSVKIGPQTSQVLSQNSVISSGSVSADSAVFQPTPRMNCSMVVKSGILYLYGGQYEEGDRQLTLSDFYALDIHKQDEWQTIVPFSSERLIWIESDESESDDDGEEEDGDDMDETSDSVEEMDTL